MKRSRRCSATTKDGRPCRNWAKRGSDPPLCARHTPRKVPRPGGNVALAEAAERPAETPEVVILEPETVIVETLPAATDPRLRPHRFYIRSYTTEELISLINLALDRSLNGEVAAARVAVRRIMQQLGEQLTPNEYARLASLVFSGTQAIARLLQTQKALSMEVAENISKWMDDALDQLGKEKGIDL